MTCSGEKNRWKHRFFIECYFNSDLFRFRNNGNFITNTVTTPVSEWAGICP